MVHMHHSQPLKTKFGNNHFLGSATLGPKQYRKGVKSTIENITDQFILFVKIIISMRSVLLSWLNNSCDFLSPSMYADSAHDDYGHSDKKVE